MRGQFVRGDGLIIPNNVSLAGRRMVLHGAFRHAEQTMYAALVTGAATLDMLMSDMTEPTIGVSGYERIGIDQDITGWPTLGDLSQEVYIESDWLEWTPSDAFDQAVQRIALVATDSYTGTDDVFALSALMPAEIVLDETTDLSLRRFKYQFYL